MEINLKHREMEMEMEMEMETEIMASHNRSLLRSPEKVDLQVPDSDVPKLFGGCAGGGGGDEEIYTMDELEGILNNIEDEDNNLAEEKNLCAQINCDFMNWEGFSVKEEEEEEEELSQRHRSLKREKCGFWVDDDDDEYDESSSKRRVSLNLSLNYQEVLDAWSDRGSLWADDYSHLSISNNGYMGEVPVMEEDRVRREASVLRYKEKRHNRLFSKKIRYEVRKLNADKRPRLKGRFVKKAPEKTLLDK